MSFLGLFGGEAKRREEQRAKRRADFQAKNNVTLTGDFGWDAGPTIFALGDGTDEAEMSVAELSRLSAVSSVIRACVDELATSAAGAGLLVGKEDDSGEFKPAKGHPALDLFYDNPEHDYGELIRLLVQRLSLTGAAFALRSKGKLDGSDAELTLLPTHLVKCISKGPVIEGWEISTGKGEPIKLGPDEVLKCWYPAPSRFVGWASPLGSAADDFAIDRERSRLTRETLKNRVLPGGFVQWKQGVENRTLTKPQRKQLSASLNAACGGGLGNRGKLAFLPAGLEYVKGADVTDIDLSFVAAMAETRICAVLGVPPIVIGLKSGLDQATYANYQEARKAFYRETMVPLWTLLASSFTRGVELGGEDLVFRFDQSQIAELKDDQDKAAVRATAVYTGGIATLDEARKIAGLPPVGGEEGDAFKAPTPSPFANPEQESEEGEEADGKEPPPDREDRATEGKRADGDQGRPDPAKRGELESALIAEGKREESEIMAMVGRGEEPPLTAPPAWDKRIADAARPVLFAAGKTGALAAFRRIKAKRHSLCIHGKAQFGSIDSSLELINPEVLAMLEKQLQEFAESIGKTTCARLREKIAAAKEAARESGRTLELAKAVREVFSEFEEWRAWRVASTELARARNASEVYAATATGQVRGFEVEARFDACEICQWHDAKGEPTGVATIPYISAETAFKEAGEYGGRVPPFHPNCMCILREVFTDEPVPKSPEIQNDWTRKPRVVPS